MATVWLPYCSGKHEVPVNQRVPVDFGRWSGPPMKWADVLLHFEVRGVPGTCGVRGEFLDVKAGDHVTGNITIDWKEGA